MTLLASFHHTPRTIRTALELIADERVPALAIVREGRPLGDLPRVLEELKADVDVTDVQQVRPTLERIFAETIAEERVALSRVERTQLLQEVEAEIFGFGSIEPLLRDETVTEILINGCNQVYVERKGLLTETSTRFRDSDELMLISTGGVLIRTLVQDIREMGRSTQGVTLINLDDGTKLAGMEKIIETDEEQE